MSDDAYQEALRRIRQAARDRSGALYLGNTRLSTLPPEIGQLTALQDLNLSNTQQIGRAHV